jgi:hypothetical protein
LTGPSEQFGHRAPPESISARGCSSTFGAADLVVAILFAISTLSFIGSREIQGVRERRIAGSAAEIVRNENWLSKKRN